MMSYGYGMMGGFGLISLVLTGLIVYAVIRLAQNGHKGNNSQRSRSAALDILNQRYANGEISDEEYAKKKKILRD